MVQSVSKSPRELEKIRFDKVTKFPLEEDQEYEDVLLENVAIYMNGGLALLFPVVLLTVYFTLWWANKSWVQVDGVDVLGWLHRFNYSY